MFRKLVLTVSLAFAIAIPAAAQDWWNLKPWPACTDGQIYVWSGGGMTCSAEQSLAAYALLAGADFTGPVSTDDDLDVTTGTATIETLDVTTAATILGCHDYGPLADYGTIGTPAECDRFFDTTLHVPCFYNGTDWLAATDGTTGCTSLE